MFSKPYIGNIVHYTSYGTPGGEYGKECRAAIVTHEYDLDEYVHLVVLNPTGMFFNTAYKGDNGDGGTWHFIGECE